MEAIDQVPFNFDPRIGLIVGIMVGFLVFAVALDLTWEQLRRVLKSPKAPAIGLLAQFGILPAVAFGAGVYLTDVPSVALGLLLVTCCPGGALSNYLTGVARGDVATSISMTTVSTLFSLVLTPHLHHSTVKDLDKRYMQQQLARAGTPAPRAIGVDEIAIRKGPTYRIVVSDLERARPIWSGGQGRREEDFDQFFAALGAKKAARLQFAVMDMWRRSAIRSSETRHTRASSSTSSTCCAT